MIDVIGTKTHDIFFNLIKSSEKEIILCSPFIKDNIVDKILSSKKPNINLKVFTSANIGNFLCGSLDLSALKKLIDNGCSVFNYQLLHAKVYFFDEKKAIITSANLTNNAMYRNYEYGVLIKEDETYALEKIRDDLYDMVLNEESCGLLTQVSIKNIEKEIFFHKAHKTIVSSDRDEDTILIIHDSMNTNLLGWKKSLFDCLNSIDSNEFTLEDVYQFSSRLSQLHPSNNYVNEKIRQVLQQLRDLGYIKFLNQGHYKKLWTKL